MRWNAIGRFVKILLIFWRNYSGLWEPGLGSVLVLDLRQLMWGGIPLLDLLNSRNLKRKNEGVWETGSGSALYEA